MASVIYLLNFQSGLLLIISSSIKSKYSSIVCFSFKSGSLILKSLYNFFDRGKLVNNSPSVLSIKYSGPFAVAFSVNFTCNKSKGEFLLVSFVSNHSRHPKDK